MIHPSGTTMQGHGQWFHFIPREKICQKIPSSIKTELKIKIKPLTNA